MKKSIFLISLFLSIISSCRKEKNCLLGGMNISFQGFDTLSDTTKYDTITIKSYTNNSLFNEEITSEKIILQNYRMTTKNNENINYYYGNPGDENFGLLTSDKDWEISFLDKKYRINSIKTKQETQKIGLFPMCVRPCYNPTIEYMMNDKIYQNSSDNMVIIQK